MLTTLLSTVIVLGILIFVHELGHFLVAKRTGVTVLRFSLGFGPKIFGITRGVTEYRLSMIPLGGYVKMLGEDSEEELSASRAGRRFFRAKCDKAAGDCVGGAAFKLCFSDPHFYLSVCIFRNSRTIARDRLSQSRIAC